MGKEKGCEAIGEWRKACVRHFYWSVTSTPPKHGDVITAKFNAFLYHIINVHENIPNEIFNKCAHPPLTTQRLWLTKGKQNLKQSFKQMVCLNKLVFTDLTNFNSQHFNRVRCILETLRCSYEQDTSKGYQTDISDCTDKLLGGISLCHKSVCSKDVGIFLPRNVQQVKDHSIYV